MAIDTATVVRQGRGARVLHCAARAAAGEDRADLVVFPESFVVGYPDWVRRLRPWRDTRWHRRFAQQSVDLGGADPDPLLEVTREAGGAPRPEMGQQRRVGADPPPRGEGGQLFVVGVTALLRGSDVPRDLPGADDVYGGDQEELSRGNTTVVAPGGTVVTGQPRGPEA